MLKEYFADHEGTAVLSTADAIGRVNAAIYSKLHIIGEDEKSLF